MVGPLPADEAAVFDTADHSRLPPATTYTTINGSVHAFCGDYGDQPGDGTPSITHDQARQQIIDATLAFVASVDRATPGAR